MDQAELKRRAQRRATKQRLETAVCWLIIIFVVITVVFMTVLLCLSLGESRPTEEPKQEETTTKLPTPDNGGTQDPQPSKPIFSNGVLPTPPTANANTVALGDEIHSQYAILIDAETGAILAGKDFDVRFSPASMTKVMTLIVAMENLTAEDLDRKLAFTEEIYNYVHSGKYMGSTNILPSEDTKGNNCLGDSYTVLDLLYGIGVASASDCTYMIATYVAQTEEAFVALMNQKALEIGMTETHFVDVAGVDGESNYSTVKDVALMMSYALQSELIKSILSQKQVYGIEEYYIWTDGKEYSYTLGTCNSSLFNTNPQKPSRIKAYEDKYGTFTLKEGLTFCGGKTGTLTDPYRYSLVSFVTKGDKTYIAVTGETTLNYGVIKDAKTIYDNYIP